MSNNPDPTPTPPDPKTPAPKKAKPQSEGSISFDPPPSDDPGEQRTMGMSLEDLAEVTGLSGVLLRGKKKDDAGEPAAAPPATPAAEAQVPAAEAVDDE